MTTFAAPDAQACPFCGMTDATTCVDYEQGTKWGAVVCNFCSARGPEVRTEYNLAESAPWRNDAVQEWNRRLEARDDR